MFKKIYKVRFFELLMVVVGTGTGKSRFLKRDWPITEGLIAGTTKQEGTTLTLIPENSNIPERQKVGLT